MTRKFTRFSDLLKGALAPEIVPGDEISDLFTDDIVFEFPYAPEGLPARLEGKAALLAHLARLGPLLEFGEMTLHRVLGGSDTKALEFSCKGRGLGTGAAYDQDYISVVTLRDGRIARYRDYWNPQVLISALGGAGAAAAAFTQEGA